jgi:hypothetical protein
VVRLLDSWFVQMTRGTVGVCKAIVQWLRVITGILQVVTLLDSWFV